MDCYDLMIPRGPHTPGSTSEVNVTSHYILQLRTKFGERAFSHARMPVPLMELIAWTHPGAEPDVGAFKKLLKTRLFNLALRTLTFWFL